MKRPSLTLPRLSLPGLSMPGLRLRGGLYATLAGLALLPAVTAGIVWISASAVDTAIDEVAERKIAALTVAATLERKARDIEVALVGMPTLPTKAALDEAAATAHAREKEALQEVERLRTLGMDILATNGMTASLMEIGKSIDAMASGVTKLQQTAEMRQAAIGKLQATAEEFSRNLAPMVLRWRSTADQVRNRLATGMLDGEALAVQSDLLGRAIGSLDPLNDLAVRIRTVESLLAQASNADKADRLPIVELRVKEELARIEANLDKVDSRLKAVLMEQIAALKPLAEGMESLVFLQRRMLGLQMGTKAQITSAAGLSADLMEQVSGAFMNTEAEVKNSVAGAGALLDQTRALLIGAAGIALGIALAAAVFYVRPRIINRLIRLGAAMRATAAGDLSVSIPAGGRDEISEMAAAVQVFRENAIEKERLGREAEETRKREEEARRREAEREEREREAAEARRREEEEAKLVAERREHEAEEQRRAERERERLAAEARRKEELAELAAGFEQAVGQVVESVAAAAREMQGLAGRLNEVVGDTRGRTSEVAEASRGASENINTVAAAAEEMAASVRDISRQLQSSSQMTQTAARDADRTNEDINGLAEAAGRIGAIVEVINGIASQTNLLALNATIEAARAGEAGKGFAVVASEVKNLATQTAKATEEVGQQIEAIQARVKQSVDAIRTIGGTVTRINEAATSIAGAVEEQGAAMEEIARSVQEAAQGSNLVSANMDAVRGSAEDTGTAAEAVQRAAEELGRSADALKDQVHGFLAKVRAA